MSPEQFLPVFAIAAFAGFVQGLTGFGSVIVALPLLALVMDIKTAIPLANIIALFISVSICVKYNDSLRWSLVRPLVLSSIPGIPAGIWLLMILPGRWLENILAIILIILSIYNFASRGRILFFMTGSWQYVSGFLSGVLGGSVGTYGPPVVVYLTSQSWPLKLIVTTMAAYFALMGAGIAMFHFAIGIISQKVAIMALLASPFMLAGSLAGSRLNRMFSSTGYRNASNLLLLFLAIILLIKQG